MKNHLDNIFINNLPYSKVDTPEVEIPSNFLNQLHILAFMSSRKNVEVLTFENKNEILAIFQIDRRFKYTIVRLLHNCDFKLIDKIINIYRPDIIVQFFSNTNKPISLFNEYFINTQGLEISDLLTISPKIYKNYLKSKIRNVDVEFRKFQGAPESIIPKINQFLNTWSSQTKLYPILDKKLLNAWSITKMGHLYYLLDKKTKLIIGYSLLSPSDSTPKDEVKYVASHACKILRGHYKLGTYLKLETIFEIKKLYPHVKLVTLGTEGSTSQKSFKETFLPLGGKFNHKIELIYCKEGITLDEETLREVKTIWVADLNS